MIDRRTNESLREELVDYWNLNRYTLATTNDIGRPKAELLAEISSRLMPTIDCCFFDDGIQGYVNERDSAPMKHVLSCVDTNSSRHAIQDQLPKVIHGASTNAMTVQLSLYDLGRGTACLKCYNESFSSLESDDDIISRLKSLDEGEVIQLAKERGMDPEKLLRFRSVPDCGMISGNELRKFANNRNSGHEFSVSFVSALSGLLLAAEVCKQVIAQQDPVRYSTCLTAKPWTDAYANFWFNSSSLNVTNPRQECWCNRGNPSPRAIYSKVWPVA
jgi:hypothetical protein